MSQASTNMSGVSIADLQVQMETAYELWRSCGRTYHYKVCAQNAAQTCLQTEHMSRAQTILNDLNSS